MRLIHLVILVFIVSSCSNIKEQKAILPNILWIIAEDQSSHYGYQGEKLVNTPYVDRLAAEGLVFKNAYVTAPVCSASRSAMITGMYQTSIGAQNHRSSRGTEKNYLSEEIKTIPEMLKNAGYYTCNSQEQFDKKGKEDYNFSYNSKNIYDGTDWSGRGDDQPFFAQIQLRGGKLRNVPNWYDEVTTGLDSTILVKAKDVILPPYYPEHPVFRNDWAEYLNTISYTDMEVGKVLNRLKRENLLDNTIIFFLTDHGISQARGKQFLYDEGTKIPFIIWAPKLVEPQFRFDLINHIDMSATTLKLAGLKVPEYMDSNPLLGEDNIPRDFIVCARDRCDETVDHIRSVRKGNYKYIKNYLPERPYLQPCAYKDHKPFMPILRKLDEQGKLNKYQKLITAQTRPVVELYDLSNDPFEVNNLANDNNHSERLNDLQVILEQWIIKTGDNGQYPESKQMYDSDMQVYINGLSQKGDTERVAIIKKNITTMNVWAEEGK